MAIFDDTNIYRERYDPNLIYRYVVGHGPNAIKKWYSVKKNNITRAMIEYDEIGGVIIIRACNKNVLKEIVESL